jgi:hypothetical protein
MQAPWNESSDLMNKIRSGMEKLKPYRTKKPRQTSNTPLASELAPMTM